MSLTKKLATVTPMSLTLAALLALVVILLVFVPAKTSASGYGTFQNRCSKYGFSKRNVVQTDGSLLNELNAEITNLTKEGLELRTPELYTVLTPGSDTVYPGKWTFHIGDCVTVTYSVSKSGKVDVIHVATQ